MTFRYSVKGLTTAIHALEEHVESFGIERDRYRAALMGIYAYRKYHTGQDASAAWHALLVEIPDIIERAVPDMPSDPDDLFASNSSFLCSTPKCDKPSYFVNYGLHLCKWHFDQIRGR